MKNAWLIEMMADPQRGRQKRSARKLQNDAVCGVVANDLVGPPFEIWSEPPNRAADEKSGAKPKHPVENEANHLHKSNLSESRPFGTRRRQAASTMLSRWGPASKERRN